MIVSGYGHNGKIEIPEEASSSPSIHPEVETLIRSLHDTLGSSYSYRATEKTDKELLAEALGDSGKYGE